MTIRKVRVLYNLQQLAWIGQCHVCGDVVFMLTDEQITVLPFEMLNVPSTVAHDCKEGDK